MVARNFHCKLGELDIVALRPHKNKQTVSLHFVEVRYRASERFGGAAASVTGAKQRKLRRAAEVFLLKNPQFRNHRAQFDVVTVSGTHCPDEMCPAEMVWIESAF